MPRMTPVGWEYTCVACGKTTLSPFAPYSVMKPWACNNGEERFIEKPLGEDGESYHLAPEIVHCIGCSVKGFSSERMTPQPVEGADEQ